MMLRRCAREASSSAASRTVVAAVAARNAPRPRQFSSFFRPLPPVVRGGGASPPALRDDGRRSPRPSRRPTPPSTAVRFLGISRHAPRARALDDDVDRPDDDDDDDLGAPNLTPESMDEYNYDPFASSPLASLDDGGYDSDAEDEKERMEAEEASEAQAIRDELDSRTGRLWSDPWEITDEDWAAGLKYDDIEDWMEGCCSRVSLERVKVYPGGIPTLSALASLPLPPSPPPHPGHGGSSAKRYVNSRKKTIKSRIAASVRDVAEPKLGSILKLSSWEDKQDAIDGLYEEVEEIVKEREGVLGKNPKFGEWVERALEDYLVEVSKGGVVGDGGDSGEKGDGGDDRKEGEGGREEVPKAESVAADDTKADDVDADADAAPIFVDLILNPPSSSSEGGGNSDSATAAVDVSVNETGVPNILHPLKSHHRDGAGRMVEEWDLAANKKTKRIMMRDCTRQIAKALSTGEDGGGAARIYVTGKRGVGKTAALAAIVASARASGHVVLYLPDGDRLRKHGYYIEPSPRHEGLYDLPVLSMEVCEELLYSHAKDLEGMIVSEECLENSMTSEQLKAASPGGGPVSLVDLLTAGKNDEEAAPGCYAAAVRALMDQTHVPFLIVMDEFNCYYDHGHYFHEEYDETVRKAIPTDMITLFKPALDGLGLWNENVGTEGNGPTALMRRGGIVVGTTESRAVARRFTDGLTASAVSLSAPSDDNPTAPVKVVEVPRFSKLEVEHYLSHLEVTGIGRLRFDRGETVMNDQEVSYLNMVSQGVGQWLMDACII